MKTLNLLVLSTIFLASFCFAETQTTKTKEILIEAVVASVGEEPITLQELCARLNPPRQLSLEEAAEDAEARQVLEMLIMEKIVHAEADAKKLATTVDEIEMYIDQVAARNNLSRKEFEKALQKEKKDMLLYKKQVETDILRTKLASSIAKSKYGVSEEEVEHYLDEHPELTKSGSKIKLNQIFIAITKERNKASAKALITDIYKELEAGAMFEELAAQFSESPEGANGGSLGVIAEEDLSRDVFDVVFSLEEGSPSEIITSEKGFHIFLVKKRFLEKDADNQELKAEIRKILEEQKMQSKMQNYFSNELYKLHAVDKKI